MAQEAVLTACVSLVRLREPARFGAWLHAIAANLARGILRRRRRTLSLESLNELPGVVYLWNAAPPDPSEVAAMRELHDSIITALSQLSPVSREAVIGFYLQGYSYTELATLLGVPTGTIKGRLAFGRRQLRSHLSAFAPLPVERVRMERPTTLQEELMEQIDLIPVSIESVQLNVYTQHRAVVLRDAERGHLLPIWIGPSEADAIAAGLEGQQFPRPMTHDLSLRLIEPFGISVQRIIISRITDNTFFSEVEVAAGTAKHRIDARPSDALALAVRSGAAIFTTREVLDQAASPTLVGDMAALMSGALPPTPVRLLLVNMGEPTRTQLLDTLFLYLGTAEVVDAPEDVVALTELVQSRPGVIVVVNVYDDLPAGQLAILRAAQPALPMVILGPMNPALEAEAREAGGRSYVVKPASAATLQAAVLDAAMVSHRGLTQARE